MKRSTLSFLLAWLAGIGLMVVFPSRSLLSGLGAATFIVCSLALIAQLVWFVVRGSASVRLRLGAAALVAAAVVLALFVVQRYQPPSDRERIENTIAAFETDTDPSDCETIATTAHLEQITGTRRPFADDRCRSEAEPRALSIQTRAIEVDGDTATALVRLNGGSFDGSEVVFGLVRSNGRWKLNRLRRFARFDRGGFDRAYRRRFLEYGAEPASADCALMKTRRWSDERIERDTLTGNRNVFIPIFVGCDRDGAERSIVEAIADRQFDLPPAAIECAANKVRDSSNAELVRLLANVVTYGRLAYACGRGAILEHQERDLVERDDLNPSAAKCVIDRFRSSSTVAAIRLGYDQARYGVLIDRCKQHS
jgi:hypothetical protein